MSPHAEAFADRDPISETTDKKTLIGTWALDLPVGACPTASQKTLPPPPPPPSSSPSPRRKMRGKTSPKPNHKTKLPPPPPPPSASPSPRRKIRSKAFSASNQKTIPPPPPPSVSPSPQRKIRRKATSTVNQRVLPPPPPPPTSPLPPSLSSPSPRGGRKSVKFSPVTRVKKVASVNTLKKKTDPGKLWFSEEELKAIDEKCRETVDRIENGCQLNEDYECVRGLEKLIQAEQVKRDGRRAEAIKAVLEEQKTQMKWGVQDTEYLADLYREYTYGSEDMAMIKGLQDSKAASLLKRDEVQ